MRKWLAAACLVAACLLVTAQQHGDTGQLGSRGGSAVPRSLLAAPVEGEAAQQQQLQTASDGSSSSSSADSAGDSVYPGFCRQMGTPEDVPALSIARTWRSARPRRPTDITLVTQLSVERLYMLEQQCGAWGSVLAAAVHVPLVGGLVISAEQQLLNGSSLAQPTLLLEEFHAKMEAGSRCTLDLVMVTEDVPTLELVGLYPVNALRNRALMQAQTEIVLLLDADFLPAANLTDMLHTPEQYARLQRSLGFRQAIVLPAFETTDEGEAGRGVAITSVNGGKEAAIDAFTRGQLKGFHMEHYYKGHRATDYSRWAASKIAYRVHYEEGFEPYVLMARRYVPWYDERFRGYRKNKVVHLLHMWKLGVQYVVTPHGYVVHSPHPKANSWAITKSTGFWDKLVKLYAEAREEMEAGTFVPATAFRCQSTEPETWSFY